MDKKISPSMMCIDNIELKECLQGLEKNGIEYLHLDVMDGVFVPNFQIGTDYVKNLRKHTNIPLDIHFMVKDIESKIEWFGLKKGDYAAVHYESTPHIHRAIQNVKATGAKVMLAINPGTSIEVVYDMVDDLDGVLIMTVNPGFAGQKLVNFTLKKITKLREWLDLNGYSNVEIEVDGNVNFENARKMSDAGANIFVAGTSSIFNSEMNMDDSIAKLRESIQ